VATVSATANPAKLKEIGVRVRSIRERRKFRQIDLAERAGISWRHLIRIEQGKGGVPQPETLNRIASALDVDRSELTGDDDEEDESLPLSRDEFALLGDLMARLGTTLSIEVSR
jgi:transcriptional regulator with XRE-family HTH domain